MRKDDAHVGSPRYGPYRGMRFNFTLLYPTARPSAPIAKTGFMK